MNDRPATTPIDILDALIWDVNRQLRALLKRRAEMEAERRKEAA